MHMHYFTIEQREALQAALNARGEQLRTSDAHAPELGDIDNALQRLHTPEYGLCADCGAEVPFSRLQANPLATRCFGCQSAFEHSHAQPGHPTL